MSMPSEEEYLDILERGHRHVAGERGFCYCAVHYDVDTSLSLWRLAIVRKNDDGYYPLSDDYFLGNEKEMFDKAFQLNDRRLKMGLNEALAVVGSSMKNKKGGIR